MSTPEIVLAAVAVALVCLSVGGYAMWAFIAPAPLARKPLKIRATLAEAAEPVFLADLDAEAVRDAVHQAIVDEYAAEVAAPPVGCALCPPYECPDVVAGPVIEAVLVEDKPWTRVADRFGPRPAFPIDAVESKTGTWHPVDGDALWSGWNPRELTSPSMEDSTALMTWRAVRAEHPEPSADPPDWDITPTRWNLIQPSPGALDRAAREIAAERDPVMAALPAGRMARNGPDRPSVNAKRGRKGGRR
jgi:hypothetical protein